jgi:hypothetical protein
MLVANAKIKLFLSESSQDSECENRIRHQHQYGEWSFFIRI